MFKTLIVLVLMCGAAHAADQDGRYSQSQHHDWVKSLHSPAGAWCCDISDGHALVDADWRSHGEGYQVNLRGAWLDVPKDAVIMEPNRIGQVIVWFYETNGKITVTCFLPGALT